MNASSRWQRGTARLYKKLVALQILSYPVCLNFQCDAISLADIKQVGQVLAGILHLGNITFGDGADGASGFFAITGRDIKSTY